MSGEAGAGSPIEDMRKTRDHAMLPLEGITVIAVEQAVAAPFCSSRLADAGAHVVKVERPEGDFARGYDAAAKGQSSYFVWLNRGKDSVIVDLATKEGRQALEELIASADVLLQNLKPGSPDVHLNTWVTMFASQAIELAVPDVTPLRWDQLV